MNLPATTYQVLQTIEEDKPLRRSNRAIWGVKSFTPETKKDEKGVNIPPISNNVYGGPQDFVQGILMGIEIGDKGSENLILKSFTHNGAELMIFGCTNLKREFYAAERKVSENPPISIFENPLYEIGAVIEVRFLSAFVDRKFAKQGEVTWIGKFKISRCAGYTLTAQDCDDINRYVAAQVPKRPLNSYQAPSMQRPQQAQYQQPNYIQAAPASYQPANYLTNPPQQMAPVNNPTYAATTYAQPAVHLQPAPQAIQYQPTQEPVAAPIPNNNSFEI